MIGRIFTVGGLTLLSRLTGFARDIVLAAVLGAGPIADAFFVALRLPNHFRAIFAEGAFNAAFVPAYARIRQQGGPDPAKLFADRVFTLLFASEIVLLAIALLFTPAVISLLAPGFSDDPGRFALAVELTRITFPYLLLVSLVTLYGGILNALSRFAAAAAAPILLNLSMMATLFDRGVFSDARPRRRLGRADRRLSRSTAGRWRRLAQRRDDGVPLAAMGRRRPTLLQGARSRDRRFGRRADRALRRHHHRQFPRRRRVVGALLCRPAQSASHRRDRHRRREPCCCRKWRAGSRPTTRRARAVPKIGRSSSPCCSRSLASWRFC